VKTLNVQYCLLLVDDSPTNLAILAAGLTGYRLLVATDGLQAIEIAEREHPDLILLDIKMPGISGYEVCSRLKQQASTRDIVIVFISGSNEEGDVSLGLALGAADYLIKPIRPGLVRACIDKYLPPAMLT